MKKFFIFCFIISVQTTLALTPLFSSQSYFANFLPTKVQTFLTQTLEKVGFAGYVYHRSETTIDTNKNTIEHVSETHAATFSTENKNVQSGKNEETQKNNNPTHQDDTKDLTKLSEEVKKKCTGNAFEDVFTGCADAKLSESEAKKKVDEAEAKKQEALDKANNETGTAGTSANPGTAGGEVVPVSQGGGAQQTLQSGQQNPSQNTGGSQSGGQQSSSGGQTNEAGAQTSNSGQTQQTQTDSGLSAPAPSAADMEQYKKTFPDSGKGGKCENFGAYGASNGGGPSNLSPKLKFDLSRLCQLTGKKILISPSGGKRSSNPIGSNCSGQSQHNCGKAIDTTMTPYSEEEQTIVTLYFMAHSYGGIGAYGNCKTCAPLHLDHRGSTMRWGPGPGGFRAVNCKNSNYYPSVQKAFSLIDVVPCNDKIDQNILKQKAADALKKIGKPDFAIDAGSLTS
jgi:hypothetical protein